MTLPYSLDILLKGRGPGHRLPFRYHHDDAGWDLYCPKDIVVWPKCVVDIDTEWNIKIPPNTWGTIKPRSSTFRNKKLVVFEGVIDPGYTGKLSVLVWNPGFLPRRIKAGDRVAQLIIVPMISTSLKEVGVMPITARGPKGFGTSGP